MYLFHTSNTIIHKPDLYAGRKNADFGQGFYLSPDSGFAGAWARERVKSGIYVNRYYADFEGLNVRTFEKNTEWLEYILSNRRGSADMLAGYDVITGPVANDTLFETFGIITSGLLSKQQALELMNIGPEYTQIVIKTERGLECIRWESAHILDAAEIAAAKQLYSVQSKDYEKSFAAAIDKMDI